MTVFHHLAKIAAGAAVVLLALGLAGCNAPRMPKLRPDVPVSTRPEPAATAYPNINIVPARTTTLRTPEQVEALERELEQARRTHVGGTQAVIAQGQ